MKRKPIQGWLTAAVLVTSLWSGTPAFAYSIGEEVKIDANQPEVSEAGFDIAKNYAVWMIEGEKTITLYDLEENTETKIGDKNSTKTSPHVDGDYVVWLDSRHGGSDVYLYDLSKKKETRVTNGSEAAQLEISGNNIVWADKREGGSDVYLYNISTGEEQKISTSKKASNPTTSDSFIAWEDTRNGNPDIYTYDIKNKRERAGVTSKGDQLHPALYLDNVIYENQNSGISQIHVYSIGKGKDRKLTSDSDDKALPHLYKDTYLFVADDDLFYGDVDDDSTDEIANRISDKLPPRVYEDYILYAKTDSDKKLRLHLYNIDDEEELPIGGVSGDPSQPAGSDRFVVYITESKKSSSVVLYDTEAKTTKVVSAADNDPIRPLVSNRYVVWYDNDEEAIMSYDIRKGKITQVTEDDQDPSDSFYELDGTNLLWVNSERKEDLILTDLSSGDSTEIASLGKDPLSIDVYGNYVTWVASESSSKASIYLYDIEEEDDTQIRRNVQVEKASIGDDFVIWSEYTNSSNATWDLYYYDMDREKVQLLMKWTARDQVDPQASRNMVLYSDNRLSPKPKDFYYEMFDVEEGSFGENYWDDKAEMADARIGGNRIVWIDNRDKNPYVYTMAFAKPIDDDDGDNGGEPGNGDFKDYDFQKVLADDSFFDIIGDNDLDKIAFVIYPGTSKEKKLSLQDALDDSDRFLDLLDEAPMDDIVIRVYK